MWENSNSGSYEMEGGEPPPHRFLISFGSRKVNRRAIMQKKTNGRAQQCSTVHLKFLILTK